MRVASFAVVTLLFVSAPARAEDLPAPPPEPKRFSIGAGYAGSMIEADVARDGNKTVASRGPGFRGRADVKGLWSLQFRYVSAETDYDSGGRLTLEQFNAHFGFRVHESARRRFRVDGCLGLTWVDLTERIPSAGLFTDRELGPSVGVGFEYGSPSWALFVDFAATFVDIQLSPGVRETLTAGNAIAGAAYRF